MFQVGDRVEIRTSIMEERYNGITGEVIELPDVNPVGAYRFRPDENFPDEPETWLIFEDEMVKL